MVECTIDHVRASYIHYYLNNLCSNLTVNAAKFLVLRIIIKIKILDYHNVTFIIKPWFLVSS